jgi:protein-S-isoprenylcysteine O-methyltransferase Ste14
MHRGLLTLAWVVGTIYATIPLFALIFRPFAKFLRARHSRLLVIIPSWFGMLAVVYLLTWQWREGVLYRTPAAWLAAVFPFAAAILIYPRSRLHFFHIQAVGRKELELGRERRLITSGIRQHIRHPAYLAHLCMLLALTVGSGEIVLYWLTVFALLTGWPMIWQEEAELERRFGEEYLAYKRAVPAVLIPSLFRVARARQR